MRSEDHCWRFGLTAGMGILEGNVIEPAVLKGQPGSLGWNLSIRGHLFLGNAGLGHHAHKGPPAGLWMVRSVGETGASLTGGRTLQRSDANFALASHFPIGPNQPSGLRSWRWSGFGRP